MKRILKSIFGHAVNDCAEIERDQKAMLDHVPAQRDRKRDWREKAVAKARERHGRQFHSHTRVERTEPPSRDLVELNEASKPSANQQEAALKVKSIRKGAK